MLENKAVEAVEPKSEFEKLQEIARLLMLRQIGLVETNGVDSDLRALAVAALLG